MNLWKTLLLIDKIILAIFVIEILLKLYAMDSASLKALDVFDFTIVAVALLPASVRLLFFVHLEFSDHFD